MSLSGQHLSLDRYQFVPRTLSFLFRDEEVLLLELSRSRPGWGGKLNGIGGHIERGENPLRSALREIWEETGIKLQDLSLVGTIAVDTDARSGICLFVYADEVGDVEPSAGSEGTPVWVPLAGLADLPVLEDLPELVPRALAVIQGHSPPFSGLYSYDRNGRLRAELLPEPGTDRGGGDGD